MYTFLKNYQVIISLLKQYGIRHLVLSAGTRNIPFVQSVENDPFFKCYSVVDERSAAYMALGMSLSLNEPVVISCTSSTATCNYYPAIAEAYHQGAQLIVLTSDRNPALLDQREDQMINQVGMYGTFVKKAVNLPVVNTPEELWWCDRLVNEAILATHHHGKGPVQINIPMLDYASVCPEKEHLTARKIDRITVESADSEWERLAKRLISKKRVMVICGQMNYTSDALNALLGEFTSKFRNVLLADYMANVRCEDAINPFLPFDAHVMSPGAFEPFIPDLVISLGGNVMAGIKGQLRNKAGQFEHWGIEPDGAIVDMYKSLTNVLECSPEYALRRFIEACPEEYAGSSEYSDMIQEYVSNIQYPELRFSNNTVIRDFAKRIPDNSILHLSINNSIRLVNFFGLPNRTTRVFANIGTHGIDGCLSSFIGQAVVENGKGLCFLVIGDLSFFYDMGAMRIKHIPKNARILLINNFGGGEFHYSTTLLNDPTMDQHTSAAHTTQAKGWVEQVGFAYYSARNQQEYDTALEYFFDQSSPKPVLIEVFSDMETDANTTRFLEETNRSETVKERMIRKAKKIIIGAIGKENAKRIANKL